MIVEGTITRIIEGREVKIPFQLNGEGYSQWGHDALTLGHNVDLLERLRDAVWEEVDLELSLDDTGIEPPRSLCGARTHLPSGLEVACLEPQRHTSTSKHRNGGVSW